MVVASLALIMLGTTLGLIGSHVDDLRLEATIHVRPQKGLIMVRRRVVAKLRHMTVAGGRVDNLGCKEARCSIVFACA